MKKYFKLNQDDMKILPSGWLKEFLLIQKNGLTGHIGNAGEPFDSFGWDEYDQTLIDEMDPLWRWVPFEQVAYWLDGAITLERLIDDKELKEKTNKIIYKVFSDIDNDSYIGPKFLKEPGRTNRWPHTVFFRAVISKYIENNDIELIRKIESHYLNNKCEYHLGRNVTNIEIMLYVYGITKNEDLLNLAIKTYDDYQNTKKDPDYCSHYTLAKELSDKKEPYEHGVTYNEISKLGAILYLYTGDNKYLNPTLNAYKKIVKYHLLPDGCPSSNEYLRGNDSNETHETCNVSDYTWSLYYLLESTKNGKYADLIERCIYNAGIGSTLENFKALQYFSGVNQIVLDKTSNHNFYRRGRDWMSFKPGHETQCCSGNVNRFFPNFVSHMWMRKKKEIDSIFYGDSIAKFKFKKEELIVNEKTNYPFDDLITFNFNGTYSGTFDLGLRIPGYSKECEIKVNGKRVNEKTVKGFMTIKGLNVNDSVTLKIVSEVTVKKYKSTGVIVEKGPILYSFGMKGMRKPYNDSLHPNIQYPMYEIYADKKWNYGIDINEADPIYEIRNKDIKWTIDNPPSIITINARKLPSFRVVHKRKIYSTNSEFNIDDFLLEGDFKFTPKIRKCISGYEDIERVTLYPYGLSKLRLSVFPRIEK